MSLKKVLKSTMALLLSVTLLPINALAAVDFDVNGSKNDGFYSVISKQDWDIAPGISESEIVLNNKEGTRRQVLHVMEADMNSEYTKVIGSYAEMNTSKYQTQTMDLQASWVEENWELNVVGAMNTCLSWYSGYPADQVGKPLGFMMVDEEVLWGECEGFPTVLVINKDKDSDGNDRPADIPKVEMVQIRTEADLDGWEEQVIPCSSGYIVKEGVNQYSESRSDSAPRSVVGIKADGTVVIMENDGRQSPFSAGMSMYELAEVMIGLGCTYAVNCDGGGSSTFLSQRPGEELEVNNSPSDGGLRPTTQGILFISTAPSDGTFVRASVEADAQYYTPDSEVQFTAKGADFAGGAADIPAEAAWQLSDSSFGTITQDGLFVSTGKTGEVSAQMVYNGEVVGEFAINIVIPDSIQFSQSTLTVPNGETTTFGVSAKYGNIDVVTKDADFEVVLDSEDMGTLDGYKLTATDDASVSGGSITATLTHDKNVTASMQVVYGKASEVVYDFENGFGDGWYVEHLQQRKNGNHAKEGINAYNNILEHYAVTSETGMVHNGDGAAAVYSDTTRGTLNWLGTSLRWAGETITYDNVKTIGMWVYFPKDAVSTAIRFCLTGVKNGEEVGIDAYPINYGDSLYFEESGWKYCAVDVSDYDSIILKQNSAWDPKNPTAGTGARIEISCQMNGGSSGEYDWKTTPGTRGENIFYLDNLIIDYSEACEDREAPVFGDVKYVEPVTSEDKVLNNQRQKTTVTKYNEIGFAAFVEENTQKVNATGLDVSSAKAYIDGNEIKCSLTNGIISVASTELKNGVHTIKFSICDKAGNSASVIRKINVQAENNDCSVRVVVPEVENNMLFTGSQHWIDIVADNAEKVHEVTLTLDLNNNNEWILDHIETLKGFTTTYTTDIAKENILYLTIKCTGDVEVTGEQTLASIPVQTWEWKEEEYPGYLPSAGGDSDLNGNSMYDPYEIWQEYVTWDCDLIVNPLAGNVKFTDGTEEWFSGEKIQLDTEQKVGTWWSASAAYKEYFKGKSSYHLHVAGETQSKAATCTEAGYKDRVFCTGCACVTEEKLGHVCDSSEGCGAVLEWGTTIPATGHDYKVNDGKLVCECETVNKITGIVKVDGKYYYSVNGSLADGWQMIDNEWYYFDETTYAAQTGELHYFAGVKYVFDSTGKLTDGVWKTTESGIRYYYGPSWYIQKWIEIDGNTYYFDKEGYAATGNRVFKNATNANPVAYVFDETGKLLYTPDTTGIFEAKEGLYYLVNGEVQVNSGLIEIEVDGKTQYIYVRTAGQLAVGEYTVWLDNGIVPYASVQTFDENGYMVIEGTGEDDDLLNGIVNENGTLYYYVDGIRQVNLGLIEIEAEGENHYIYVRTAGQLAVGEYTVWLNHGIVPYASVQTFDENGYMVTTKDDTKDGIVNENGTLYYYVDGEKQVNLGLIEIEAEGENHYIYVRTAGQLAVGEYTVWLNHGIVPYASVQTFDENGYMVTTKDEAKDGIINENGTLYYYIDGERQVNLGLIEIEVEGENHYIYVRTAGQLAVGEYTVWLNHGIVPYASVQTFDNNGYMIVK